MRRTLMVASVAVAAIPSGCSSPQVLATANTVTVRVTIICEGDSVRALVSPFVRTAGTTGTEANEVDWVLTDESTVTELSISKKGSDGKKWPFAARMPLKSAKQNPGKSGKMKSNPKFDDPYGYDISASCKLPLSGKTANIKIDPDMIIVHGLVSEP